MIEERIRGRVGRLASGYICVEKVISGG